MKRWVKVLAISLGSIIVLWIALRITGALQFYKIPTPSSEPNVHVGQSVWTTNLKKPKRGDLVAYLCYRTDSINQFYGVYQEAEIRHDRYLHRLCAVENDVIEMKDGVFFVNGANADAGINLFHFYKVAAKYEDKLPKEEDNSESPYAYRPPYSEDTIVINLTTEDIKTLSRQFPIEKYFNDRVDTSQFAVFAWCNKSSEWSADNFGPLTVPKGYCFVLGDNRDNALDSRYSGFIKLSDIKGVRL